MTKSAQCCAFPVCCKFDFKSEVKERKEVIAVAIVSILVLAGISFWLSQISISLPIKGCILGSTFVIGCAVTALIGKCSSHSAVGIKKEETPSQVAHRLEIVYPPIKVKKTYDIDRSKVEQLLDCVEDKETISFLIENMQHITFKQLEEGLKQCVQALNDKIKNVPYAVGLGREKSSEWILSLSLEYLETFPKERFELENICSSLGIVHIDKPTRFSLTTSLSHLVLFDDCAYSGEQLLSALSAINQTLSKNSLSSKREVFLVVPFVSDSFYQKLRNSAYDHINVQLITTEKRIQTVDEIYGEKREVVSKVFWDEFTTLGTGRTLCWTDWRYPDETSTMRIGRISKTLFKPALTIKKNGTVQAQDAEFPEECFKYRMRFPYILHLPDHLIIKQSSGKVDTIPFPNGIQLLADHSIHVPDSLQNQYAYILKKEKTLLPIIPPIPRPYGQSNPDGSPQVS